LRLNEGAYTSDGKLLSLLEVLQKGGQDHSTPIFECNSMCKCTRDCSNRILQRGILVKLKVLKSKEKGWCVYTDAPISKGQFVCEYTGQFISTNEANERWKLYDIKHSNYILVLREYIASRDVFYRTNIDSTIIGNVARYINHSCDPNLAMFAVRVDSLIPRIGLFAAKDIDKNQELTFSYGTTHNTVDSNPKNQIPCHCGTAYCCKYLPYDPSV